MKDSGPFPASAESELRAWMLASIDGDREAYEKFLNRVAGILSAYLLNSMLPQQLSVEKVEELTQDVLLSIHTKRGTYRPEMPIMPWIYAIGKYRLIDSIRRDGRHPETVEWDPSIEKQVLRDAEDTLGTLNSADLDTLLARLNDRQRKIVKLAKLDDVPLADIATQMKMSLSAVKVTVHRALRSLQRKHGGDRHDPRNLQ